MRKGVTSNPVFASDETKVRPQSPNTFVVGYDSNGGPLGMLFRERSALCNPQAHMDFVASVAQGNV